MFSKQEIPLGFVKIVEKDNIMKYLVEGEYRIREWFSVEIDAEDEIEAEKLALAEIRLTAPEEACEFEVLDTKELN